MVALHAALGLDRPPAELTLRNMTLRAVVVFGAGIRPAD